jgi:hypothetical protein
VETNETISIVDPLTNKVLDQRTFDTRNGAAKQNKFSKEIFPYQEKLLPSDTPKKLAYPFIQSAFEYQTSPVFRW